MKKNVQIFAPTGGLIRDVCKIKKLGKLKTKKGIREIMNRVYGEIRFV